MSGFGSSASAINAETRKIANAALGVASIDSVGGRLRSCLYTPYYRRIGLPGGAYIGWEEITAASAIRVRHVNVFCTGSMATRINYEFGTGAGGAEVKFAGVSFNTSLWSGTYNFTVNIPLGTRIAWRAFSAIAVGSVQIAISYGG